MKKLLILLIGVGLLGIVLPTRAIGARLEVQLIAQEDQLREKGIMILCPDALPPDPTGLLCIAQGGVFTPTALQRCTPPSINPCEVNPGVAIEEVRDRHAEFKIDVRLDGVNVTPDSVTCIIIEKEVCHIPPDSGDKGDPQGEGGEATELFDISEHFVCKYHEEEGAPGVGILEVFYTGEADDERLIGDHIIKVVAERDRVVGGAIHDICILGAPTCGIFGDCNDFDKVPNFKFSVKWSSLRAERLFKFADPIYPFASCKNLGAFEREIYISSATTSVPDCTDDP